MASFFRLLPERFERRAEGLYPWLGGVVALLLAARFLPAWAIKSAPTLVDPVINVAAIAVAFLVAVAVMLAPLKAEPVIRELQRIDAFPVLLGYVRSAIYIWVVVIVLGLLVKIIPAQAIALGSVFEVTRDPRLPHPTWLTVFVVAWAATLVAGGLAGHRIVRILFALLRYRDPRLARQAPPADHPDDDGEQLRLPPERRRAAR
jgi:hypothetical protein